MTENAPQDEMTLVPLTDGELTLEVSEMEAIGLKSLLLASGVEAVIVGASQLPNLPYQIYVPASQAAEAIRLVREAGQAGPLAAEAAEAEGEAAGDMPPEE
jgi:hypothetical protein